MSAAYRFMADPAGLSPQSSSQAVQPGPGLHARRSTLAPRNPNMIWGGQHSPSSLVRSLCVCVSVHALSLESASALLRAWSRHSHTVYAQKSYNN